MGNIPSNACEQNFHGYQAIRAFNMRSGLFVCFICIISNSLKFSNAERLPIINITCKIESNIQLSTHKLLHKNYCHIVVSDNGIGFKPEYSEKTFEVFQRLHTTKQYLGTVIGLAIVKNRRQPQRHYHCFQPIKQ